MIGAIIAAASAAMQIGGAIAGNRAQKRAAKANAKDAKRAMNESFKDIGVRALQERQAAAQQSRQIDQQTTSAAAMARLSALGGGVQGQSVDAQSMELERERGEAKVNLAANLDMVNAQLARQRAGASSQAQSRINTNAGPSNFGTALQIGGSLLDLGNQYVRSRPVGS